MFALPLAVLEDPRDYAYFLASMATAALCLTSAVLTVAFPEWIPGFSTVSRCFGAAFMLLTGTIVAAFAFSLAFDFPLLNLAENSGPVEWSITIIAFSQAILLAGYLFFHTRDLLRKMTPGDKGDD